MLVFEGGVLFAVTMLDNHKMIVPELQ